MKKLIPFLALALFAGAIYAEDPQDKLVVHEWGTFTSLQDEDGNAIGGINTDDEPLPPFVHRLAYYLMLPPGENTGLDFSVASKGITPHCHPDVTMRLETPVIYFHPPADWKAQPIDVHVAFHGGWLSEFYPDAIFRVPGFDKGYPDSVYSNATRNETFSGFGHIKPDASGELSWKGLILGAENAGPETQEKVWLAPRDVKAAPVKTTAGECEKFLFYRGVGNVRPPLQIVRDETSNTLKVEDAHRLLAMLGAEDNLRIHAAWLVDVRADGVCAFRSCETLEWKPQPRVVLPASFDLSAFTPDNLARLKTQMRGALINEGLFADEADALLKTWEAAYFKSPGLRFFYICPRVDVDAALPLEISAPSIVTRVMIGRIELVTPEQRALLKKLAADPRPGDYAKLGRFRNALILDEQKRHPSQALDEFIQKHDLGACKIE